MKIKNLKYLLSPWIKNIPEQNFQNLIIDSRLTSPGDVFIYIKSKKKNRTNFLLEAIQNQVIAVISETDKRIKHGKIYHINNVLIIFFFKLSKYVSSLSGRFYNYPGNHLNIVGVTGTNGKTTVTQIIAQWNKILGKKTAIMGTLGNGCYPFLKKTQNTTSSAIENQCFLYQTLQKKIKIVTIEVSSHGLIQNRVKKLPFAIAIFTNLTQDHLDYHKTMQKYEEAKWSFFKTHLIKKIILNANDKIGKKWLKKLFNQYTVAVTISDSTQKKYATKWINATNIQFHINFIDITFESSWGNGKFSSILMGKFNAMNLLLSMACLLELENDLSILTNTSIKINPIYGRMEKFDFPDKPICIIDYAHTPDALKKTLQTIRLNYKKKKYGAYLAVEAKEI